jgi:hypothetical protein
MTREALETKGIKGNTNCKLSYTSGDGARSVDVRVRKLAHRFDVIATESHARGFRAMYPHQRAVSQFALTIELKGHGEYEPFMQFMATYVMGLRNSWSNPIGNSDVPMMSVVMAVRNFSRKGFPVRGMSFQDHVGSNVFMPTIVFQAAADPLDTEIVAPSSSSSTSFGKSDTKTDSKTAAKSEADSRNFFYPFSPGSEDPNVKAETMYDFSGFDSLAIHPADMASGAAGAGGNPLTRNGTVG